MLHYLLRGDIMSVLVNALITIVAASAAESYKVAWDAFSWSGM